MSPEITGEKKRLRAVAAQRSRVFEAARSNPRCWYDTNICTHLNYTLEKMQNESIYIMCIYIYACMNACVVKPENTQILESILSWIFRNDQHGFRSAGMIMYVGLCVHDTVYIVCV